jgi:hypothetical protein
LELTFQIANPTSLPLTLHGIITKVDGKDATGLERPITLLTPSNPFLESVGIALDDEQERLYAGDALSLKIECTVLFADSHGIHWSQEFGRRVLCTHTGNIVTDIKNTLQESGIPRDK